MHYAIQHHSILNAQHLHKNSNSALPGALPLLSCIQTWHGAGESCCRICLQVEAYLDPPREAEKSSLLNMAIDPVTTALALLRACGKGKQLKQNTCAYRHLCIGSTPETDLAAVAMTVTSVCPADIACTWTLKGLTGSRDSLVQCTCGWMPVGIACTERLVMKDCNPNHHDCKSSLAASPDMPSWHQQLTAG